MAEESASKAKWGVAPSFDYTYLMPLLDFGPKATVQICNDRVTDWSRLAWLQAAGQIPTALHSQFRIHSLQVTTGFRSQ